MPRSQTTASNKQHINANHQHAITQKTEVPPSIR